jgi:hypothetical protein
MVIACLGWGSLIWNPVDLPVSSEWKNDGPFLPIEFARESADGRMTLVLVDKQKTVQSLWTYLQVSSIEEAKSALAEREGISDKYIEYSVGYWDSASNSMHGKCSDVIQSWAMEKGLDGVVWTNLKYGFKSARDLMPEITHIINHLKNLTPKQKRTAEEYVRKTPLQVGTEYRGIIEVELGWVQA